MLEMAFFRKSYRWHNRRRGSEMYQTSFKSSWWKHPLGWDPLVLRIHVMPAILWYNCFLAYGLPELPRDGSKILLIVKKATPWHPASDNKAWRITPSVRGLLGLPPESDTINSWQCISKRSFFTLGSQAASEKHQKKETRNAQNHGH